MNNTPVSHQNKKSLMPRMMIIILTIMMAVAANAGPAPAKTDQNGGYVGPGQSGGYTGPGPNFVTAAQAKSMDDDAHVALKGYIVQHLGGDSYLFKDGSGDIKLEISEKRWAGQQVGAEDLVEIYGEIDKDWFDLEIEVKRLVKLKN